MAVTDHSADDGLHFSIEPAEALPLTSECKHYRNTHEVPWDIQKYFEQRYSIFSRYDDGIRLTDEAWFGVTPEPVARKVAKRAMCIHRGKSVLIDAFAGAGGNTIAFAKSRHWRRIIAIERDAATLACAQHNAAVCGLDSSIITWVLADSFEFLDSLTRHGSELHPALQINISEAVVFASPPWGGPGYRTDQIFDLQTMQPYNLTILNLAYRSLDHMLFLPRTSDLRQIAKLTSDENRIEVVQYCMEGASKGMVAYIPGR